MYYLLCGKRGFDSLILVTLFVLTLYVCLICRLAGNVFDYTIDSDALIWQFFVRFGPALNHWNRLILFVRF